MTFIRTYIENGYEITQYSSGGTIRKYPNGEILAEYVNFWSKDGELNPTTQAQLESIKEKFGICVWGV